ncbi:MAG: sensor histidine kinase [Actinobacteria bacterium 13_2_20CM_2_71_6]|nr:MAG: sensor histidine kinase [Actinobacteria bacterium 13_2_20CM_2_71_6]
MTVLRALWSARSWRATVHALVGLPLGILGGAVIGGLFLVWDAAIWSLLSGPGDWVLAVVYVLVAVVGPVPLLWAVRAFSAVQRARFRMVLGVDIPPLPRVPGSWPLRLVRPWRAASTWRQLCYHLVAPVAGTAGGALVAICWSATALALGYAGVLWSDGRQPGLGIGVTALGLALLVAAPWVARGVTRADTAVARALLGPNRTEELARRVETLSRSRSDIVAATDAERRRIERDLHDGAQQRLVSLAMNLGMARANLTDAPEPARQAIEAAHEEATQALAELREFVRGLHPAVLNDRGLDAALSGIVARAPLPVRLHVDVATRCSPSIEAVAYFVVSEALTNVAKHAHAEHAEVTVRRTGDRLRVVVTDDGRGGAVLDPGSGSGAETETETGSASGSGLRGLVQRAAAFDGTLTIQSPPGGPTTITAELPCES